MSGNTLELIEKLLDNGDAETIVALCAPGGAEQFAAKVLANDPPTAKEFDSRADLIAAFLRSRAKPQLRDAERALREPGKAPRLALGSSPAAVLHAMTASAPEPVPTPSAQLSPPARAGHGAGAAPSVRLAAAPPPRAKVKLCCGANGPSPCDLAIVAQNPDLYCL